MRAIPPDLASKVIGADLRNLVKKVSDGSVLTQGEREMMERATVEGVLPEALQKARAAALLRRFALGQNLSKDQKSELSQVLPVTKPVAKRVTSETYLHKLKHYVSILGIEGKDPTKKLKRWIAAGRAKTPPDLPPFDDPPQMADWWRRCMEIRVPHYLLRFEQRGDTPPPQEHEAPPPPPAANGGKPPPPGEALGMPMMLDMGAEVSSDLGLQQIRALVVATFDQLQRCLASGHLSQANQYRREWQTLVGTLRQWEKDIVKIQEGKGEVMRTRIINTELVRIFNVMRQSFTNTMLDLCEQLAPQMPPQERRELVLKQRDKCFTHLKGTRFSQTYQPDD